jgi:hypothetical protein
VEIYAVAFATAFPLDDAAEDISKYRKISYDDGPALSGDCAARALPA